MWRVVTSCGVVWCDQQCVVCGVTSRVRLGGRSTQGAIVGATLDIGCRTLVPEWVPSGGMWVSWGGSVGPWVGGGCPSNGQHLPKQKQRVGDTENLACWLSVVRGVVCCVAFGLSMRGLKII